MMKEEEDVEEAEVKAEVVLCSASNANKRVIWLVIVLTLIKGKEVADVEAQAVVVEVAHASSVEKKAISQENVQTKIVVVMVTEDEAEAVAEEEEAELASSVNRKDTWLEIAPMNKLKEDLTKGNEEMTEVLLEEKMTVATMTGTITVIIMAMVEDTKSHLIGVRLQTTTSQRIGGTLRPKDGAIEVAIRFQVIIRLALIEVSFLIS
jgi:hypothetical protein